MRGEKALCRANIGVTCDRRIMRRLVERVMFAEEIFGVKCHAIGIIGLSWLPVISSHTVQLKHETWLSKYVISSSFDQLAPLRHFARS